MYRTLCVNSLNAMSSCGSKSVGHAPLGARRCSEGAVALHRGESRGRRCAVAAARTGGDVEKVEVALELRLQPDAHRFLHRSNTPVT